MINMTYRHTSSQIHRSSDALQKWSFQFLHRQQVRASRLKQHWLAIWYPYLKSWCIVSHIYARLSMLSLRWNLTEASGVIVTGNCWIFRSPNELEHQGPSHLEKSFTFGYLYLSDWLSRVCRPENTLPFSISLRNDIASFNWGSPFLF